MQRSTVGRGYEVRVLRGGIESVVSVLWAIETDRGRARKEGAEEGFTRREEESSFESALSRDRWLLK